MNWFDILCYVAVPIAVVFAIIAGIASLTRPPPIRSLPIDQQDNNEVGAAMFARLLTILAVLVAIGAVSWGMQADAEGDCGGFPCPMFQHDPDAPLDERIAVLEQEIEVLRRQTNAIGTSWPPLAPRPDTDLQFFNPDPIYTFEVSCRMNQYPLPGDGNFPLDVRMQCIRYSP